MYSDILRRITGIEVFPVISLVIFVAVFTGALVWTMRLDATRIQRVARLPLDDDEGAPEGPSAGAPRLSRRDA